MGISNKNIRYTIKRQKNNTTGHIYFYCGVSSYISSKNKPTQYTWTGSFSNPQNKSLLEPYIIKEFEIQILDELCVSPVLWILYLNHTSPVIKLIANLMVDGKTLIEKTEIGV